MTSRKKSKVIAHISEGISGFFQNWIREFQVIFSDVGVMVIIFAVPLIYPVLYSLIYYPEVVREMPVAVTDLSQSRESREFIRNLNATPELQVAFQAQGMNESIEQFKKRKVKGIVLIPESFSRDIANRHQTVISAYADMGFFLHYKALMTGVNFVALETGKQIQVQNLTNTGLGTHQSEIKANPLQLIDNAMANHGGGFASYGVPAALILIIQQTLVLAIGILAGTARERHPNGELVPPDKERLGTLRLVAGKTAAYFSIYALLCVYMLGLIPQLFGYSRTASFYELMTLLIPFLLSSVFMGLTLSVFFKNRESAMMLYLFTSIPLLFLSGIIWPLSNFSPLWLAVRQFFPSSDAIFGFIKLNSLGASVTETSKEIASLWIHTAIFLLTACAAYAYEVLAGSRKYELQSKNG